MTNTESQSPSLDQSYAAWDAIDSVRSQPPAIFEAVGGSSEEYDKTRAEQAMKRAVDQRIAVVAFILAAHNISDRVNDNGRGGDDRKPEEMKASQEQITSMLNAT